MQNGRCPTQRGFGNENHEFEDLPDASAEGQQALKYMLTNIPKRAQTINRAQGTDTWGEHTEST